MATSATTVAAYLAALPADRRAELEKLRAVILANLDRDGIEEGMQYGMIGYYVPHRLFAAGYHCDPKQPLPFAGLAAQKSHSSLHLMGLYMGQLPGSPARDLYEWFVAAWKKSGKKLDMGKACIRFKKADDLALDVIGEAFRRMTGQRYVAAYVAARDSQAKKGPTPRAQIQAAVAARKKTKAAGATKKPDAKKPATKTPAAKRGKS